MSQRRVILYAMEKRRSSQGSGEDAGTGTPSHTHTLSFKNHIVMGHTKVLLRDLDHHVLALDISTNLDLDG